MRCVKIVIAESHPLILYGLTSLLRAEDHFNVVASCCDGVKCIQAIREWSPDITLLDMCLPGLTSFDILAAVRLDCLEQLAGGHMPLSPRRLRLGFRWIFCDRSRPAGCCRSRF